MKIQWVSKKLLFPTAIKRILPTPVILDIGCGIQPQEFILPKIHICCDPHHEYIAYLQKKYAYDTKYLFFQAKWQEIISLLPPKSVDAVFLLDVVEHLPKTEAKRLLVLTEKIARKQIIIFTPLGFITQHHDEGKDAWGMHGGSWQEHKSGWMPDDFNESWEIFASRDFHDRYYAGVVRKKSMGHFGQSKHFHKSIRKHPYIKQLFTCCFIHLQEVIHLFFF